MDNLKAKRLERLDAMKRKSLKKKKNVNSSKKKKQLGVRAPNQKQKIFSRPGSSSGSTATGSPSFQKRKGGSGRGIQGGKSGGARGEGVTELIESILQTNPKLSGQGMASSNAKKGAWLAKVVDKTLAFDNPTSSVSLSKAQKASMKHKLSNCVAVREVSRQRRRFLTTHLENLKGACSHSKNVYQQLKPLNDMWLDYTTKWQEQNRGASNMKDALSTLELRGATVQVLSSSFPNYKNVRGVVADVMSRSFRIITSENRIFTVPVKGCVFQVDAKDFSFLIHGDEALKRKSFQQ